MIEEALARLVGRFNQKVDASPKLQEELSGLDKTIAVHLTDGPTYAADLRQAHLVNLRPEATPKADLTITTDSETFTRLVAKEMGPMKALALRKLVLEGSLEDKLTLRKLL